MTIMMRCECGSTLSVPLTCAGATTPCPVCRKSVVVPQAPAPRQAPPPLPADPLVEQVRAEISRKADGKLSIGKNLATLAVTLVLFVSLGLFGETVSGVLLLVLVLLVHEGGHFLGMKLFGYKDVRMFFIPMLGAAVSGHETNPSAARKAVVSLMGPAPGIVIGAAAAIAHTATREPVLAEAARTFIFLNAFNLLPFHPLDGGRIVEDVLFSRHPWIEMGFKVLTTLALGLLAFLAKDIFLGLLAFVVFVSLRATQITAGIAHAVRREAGGAGASGREIPLPVLERIVTMLKGKIPSQQWKPQLFATYASGIWQKVCNRPSSIAASIGILLCYVFFLLLGLFAGALFMASSQPKLPSTGAAAVAARVVAGGETVSSSGELIG